MSDYIKKNPGKEPYRFMLERAFLNGEELSKEDLDAICPDRGVVILEGDAQCLEETKRFNREFTTVHLKVHTLKILMDGTLIIETAAKITPYADTGLSGATPFNAEEIADILKELNKAGLDLHAHCVGERSSHVVLDGVELARKELGESFRVKVTVTHMWIQDDADLDRFAKLGVVANYTPAWHNGNMGLGCEPSEFWPHLIGEEASATTCRRKCISAERK